MKVELEKTTLAVLIAGLYCTYNSVDSIAIPESIFLTVAEQLEFFLDSWDYDVISFEDWVKTCLLIIPKVMLDENDLKEMQSKSLYWEYPNGNVVLVVSMNIEPINRSANNGEFL